MRMQPIYVVLTLALAVACGKEELPGDEGNDEDNGSSETNANDGDEDAVPDTGNSNSNGDGDGDPGDGDGDPDTGFVPMVDVVGVTDCDPLAQDCPDGEKCIAYASTGGTWDANKCVPVTGSNSAGDPCVYDGSAVGTDDCDEDTVCWNALDVDGQLIGTCYPFCTGSIDDPMCDDPDLTCRVVNDGTITVCLPTCDPLLQECMEGLGCYWSGTSNTFQCIIVAPGIPTGEPCGFNNDCNPGNFCADAAVVDMCQGSACCAAFCDITEDPVPCPMPYDCVPFFDEGTAPPNYENVGLCILPP